MNLNHGVIGRCKSRVRWHSTPGLTETIMCLRSKRTSAPDVSG